MGPATPSNATRSEIALRNGRRVRFGFDRIPMADRPRHRHKHAYATVVLSGSFDQAGYFGRHHVEAGDGLLQPTPDGPPRPLPTRGLQGISLPGEFGTANGGRVSASRL